MGDYRDKRGGSIVRLRKAAFLERDVPTVGAFWGRGGWARRRLTLRGGRVWVVSFFLAGGSRDGTARGKDRQASNRRGQIGVGDRHAMCSSCLALTLTPGC